MYVARAQSLEVFTPSVRVRVRLCGLWLHRNAPRPKKKKKRTCGGKIKPKIVFTLCIAHETSVECCFYKIARVFAS